MVILLILNNTEPTLHAQPPALLVEATQKPPLGPWRRRALETPTPQDEGEKEDGPGNSSMLGRG